MTLIVPKKQSPEDATIVAPAVVSIINTKSNTRPAAAVGRVTSIAAALTAINFPASDALSVVAAVNVKTSFLPSDTRSNLSSSLFCPYIGLAIIYPLTLVSTQHGLQAY